MTRIARGIGMAKAGWRFVRRNPDLIALPAVSFAAIGAATLIIFSPVLYVAAARHARPPTAQLVVLAVLAIYELTFIGVFFRVALASVAARRLEGAHAPLKSGIRVAWSRTGAIARWSLIATTVGVALRAVRQIPWAGDAIAAVVLGTAWGAVTAFVVPVLALEPGGARSALKRSGHTFRARWGEEATGLVSITAAGVIVSAPLFVLFAVGGALTPASAPAGIALMLLAVLSLVAVVLVVTTLDQIFLVALYRYASGGAPPDGFDSEGLERAVR